eukprot:COSAG01_NODE_2067_length_8506_cov_221.825384_11_plen_123_part_00
MGGRGARGLCADNWQVARPVRHQDGGIMARAWGDLAAAPPAAAARGARARMHATMHGLQIEPDSAKNIVWRDGERSRIPCPALALRRCSRQTGSSYGSLALGDSLTSLMGDHPQSRNVDLYM